MFVSVLDILLDICNILLDSYLLCVFMYKGNKYPVAYWVLMALNLLNKFLLTKCYAITLTWNFCVL